MFRQISKIMIVLWLFPHSMAAIHAQQAARKFDAATSPLAALV